MGRIRTKISDRWTEVPVDEDQAAAIYDEYRNTLERLRDLFEEGDGDELLQADLGRALGRFAEAARLHGDYDVALTTRDESATIWRQMGRSRAWVLARIQAADMAHLAGEDDAWRRFDELADVVTEEKYRLYADFLEEFRALACCREERFEDALHLMRRVLERRVDEGRKDRQLSETREIIARIQDKCI